MEAKEKARKAGAEKFVYNGKTYKKQVTKTELIFYNN